MLRTFLVAVMFLSLLSGTALAQSSNATLVGTVSDASGALIPGVTVTATNTATGIASTVVSNEAGSYQFASLQTGTYTVTAELPGFRLQSFNSVTLGISQQMRLNFTLEVGAITDTVEVTATSDTLIATTSSSVGTVLPDYKVRDLPLGGRNVMDLLGTGSGVSNATAGGAVSDGNPGGAAGYFAGGRLTGVNTTRDGFTVSDGRYNLGAYSITYSSSDLVEEVRIITAPVDAEMARGSGQIQMVTRSGTNDFRGSLFWNNRNSALDAANWFNNFNGVEKNYENRNQFGGRIGGPIIRNKTFFFVLIDEQRYVLKQNFVGTVLTPQARQGIFRFFPGADNQNALQNNPSVDRNGNPVRPAGATGPLQEFSVFNRDSFRPGFDPTGWIQNVYLARMPMPNDYTVGDGLNVAGIRWTRRISGLDINNGGGYDTNRDQFNMRLDHLVSANHKFSLMYTWEKNGDLTIGQVAQWPGGFDGSVARHPRLLNLSFVSTLSSSLVNEFRAGYQRSTNPVSQAFWKGRDFREDNTSPEPAEEGREAFELLPLIRGLRVPAAPVSAQAFMSLSGSGPSTRYHYSPQFMIGDTLSWTSGRHGLKFGGEWMHIYTDAGIGAMHPAIRLGAGGVPVQNIDNVAIPGLTGNNQTRARNLLTDLSGSVASITQGFDVTSPSDRQFKGFTDGLAMQIRDFRRTDFSWFLKDTWQVRPALTFNVGIRWDWYGVPYENNGLAAVPVERERSLCGFSCGTSTLAHFVGKNSDHPDQNVHDNEWNNFAPSLGFSWSLPWFGAGKTTLRAGYGWNYTRPGSGSAGGGGGPVTPLGGVPGTSAMSGQSGLTYTQSGYMSLANVPLPIPIPFAPLQAIPIDGSRNESIGMFATKHRTPYVQNFNISIQRELTPNMTLDIAYIGSKGTRLTNNIELNYVDIYKNGFLQAFNETRAGGNAKLFDDMLRGMPIPGAGTVNGTTVTGSAALRTYTATRAFIANGEAASLADFLNRSTNITNKGGGFVRNSGLFPENFFVMNPQFNSISVIDNPSSSTYHSLEAKVTKRLSQGFTTQATYTWSRALGTADGDGFFNFRDPNNRDLDKALLGFHRTHSFQANGIWSLPFGPNRRFVNNTSGFVQRLVETWQFGTVFNRVSGPPINLTAPIATVVQKPTHQYAAPFTMTPNIVGDFPKDTGAVTKVANGVVYFPGLQQIQDPAVNQITALNALRGGFSNLAIADSNGQVLLVNPNPGEVGTLGRKWIQGPSSLQFDVNLIKRVRLAETKDMEIRVDVVNVLNHPNFGIPNTEINSPSFGRIDSAEGNRRFTLGARLNF